MKKFIPKSHRHRVIENAVATPVLADGLLPAMTVVRVPGALASAENCVTALICRRTAADAVAHVYLGRTYAFTGDAPQSFMALGSVRGFALKGALQNLTALRYPTNPLPGLADPKLAVVDVKLEGVDQVMPDVADFDALADTMLLFLNGEIMSVARARLVDGIYSLTVLRSRFDTVGTTQPGETVWIAQRARLKFFGHPIFAVGNTARFKITVGKEPLANAIPFEIKL